MDNLEAILRVATLGLGLLINGFVIWHFFGKELRRWWRSTIAATYLEKWEDARAWRAEWRKVWEMEATGD